MFTMFRIHQFFCFFLCSFFLMWTIYSAFFFKHVECLISSSFLLLFAILGHSSFFFCVLSGSWVCEMDIEICGCFISNTSEWSRLCWQNSVKLSFFLFSIWFHTLSVTFCILQHFANDIWRLANDNGHIFLGAGVDINTCGNGDVDCWSGVDGFGITRDVKFNFL